MKIWVYTFLFLLLLFRFYVTKTVYQNGQEVVLTQKVLQEPIRYSSYQSLSFPGLKIYLPLYPEIVYGDTVSVTGIYQNGKLTAPKLISIKPARGLYNFRQKLISFYQKNLPEPHASLVSGIVLGSKSSLPEKFWNELKITGVAHVVVASGTNVTFVAGFLISMATLFLSRRKAVIFVITSIWLYAILSGLESPIIRATVMATAVLGAQAMGKLALTWKVLILTVYIMLCYNPVWVGDIGFILSFVATASLALFQKKVEIIFSFFPKVIKEGLSTSISAQIGVAPILFVTFGQFNILSPVINALVLWTVAPIMIIGSLSAVLGLKYLLYLVYPLTWWFIKCINFGNLFS